MDRIFQFMRQLPQAVYDTIFPFQNEIDQNPSTLGSSTTSSSQSADQPAMELSQELVSLPLLPRDKDVPVQTEIHEPSSALASSLSSPQSAMSEPCGFMNLDEKLRKKVYCLCLIVDGHVTPYREFYAHDDHHDYKGDKLANYLPLLQVSKTVREEAEKIFWGENTFRVTPCAVQFTGTDLLDRRFKLFSYDLEDAHPDHKINTIWFRKGHLIRHAVTTYDQLDFDPKAIKRRSEELKHTPMTTKERSESMHDTYTDQMRWTWRFKNNAFRTFENLEVLDIDVKGLNCRFGCCRVDTFEGLFNHLDGCLVNLPDNVQINVSAITCWEEKQVFKHGGWTKRNMTLEERYAVTLNPINLEPRPTTSLAGYAVKNGIARPPTQAQLEEVKQILEARKQKRETVTYR